MERAINRSDHEMGLSRRILVGVGSAALTMRLPKVATAQALPRAEPTSMGLRPEGMAKLDAGLKSLVDKGKRAGLV